MWSFTTQALLLSSVPYRQQQIITLFSREHGVLSAIRRGKFQISSPLEAEFTLEKSQGSLYRCTEISAFNYYPLLRENFSVLQSACLMLDAIRRSQPPEKTASQLYLLLVHFLKALPLFKSPETLYASFLLKLLRYEGALHLTNYCQTCSLSLSDCYISDHGCHCALHRTPYALHLEAETYKNLRILAEERHLDRIHIAPPPFASISCAKQLYHWYVDERKT